MSQAEVIAFLNSKNKWYSCTEISEALGKKCAQIMKKLRKYNMVEFREPTINERVASNQYFIYRGKK